MFNPSHRFCYSLPPSSLFYASKTSFLLFHPRRLPPRRASVVTTYLEAVAISSLGKPSRLQSCSRLLISPSHPFPIFSSSSSPPHSITRHWPSVNFLRHFRFPPTLLDSFFLLSSFAVISASSHFEHFRLQYDFSFASRKRCCLLAFISLPLLFQPTVGVVHCLFLSYHRFSFSALLPGSLLTIVFRAGLRCICGHLFSY